MDYTGHDSTYGVLERESKEIRLIQLLPSQDSETVLRCDLSYCNLNDGHEYTALSYCWDQPDPAQIIILEGHPHQVGPNLYAALKQLRLRDTVAILWINAWCIDQDDDDERGHQVGLMGNIFADAGLVIMWVGLETEECALAQKLSKHVSEAFEAIAVSDIREGLEAFWK